MIVQDATVIEFTDGTAPWVLPNDGRSSVETMDTPFVRVWQKSDSGDRQTFTYIPWHRIKDVTVEIRREPN